LAVIEDILVSVRFIKWEKCSQVQCILIDSSSLQSVTAFVKIVESVDEFCEFVVR